MNIEDYVNESGPVRDISLGENQAAVILTGDIDMECSPDLRVAMKEIILEKIPQIVIDMSSVSYMDSSGVATLVEVLQQVKRYKGRLILIGLQSRVRSVFEIARLTDIFEIYGDSSEIPDNG